MRKLTAIGAIWAVLALPGLALAQVENTVPAVGDPPEAAAPNAEYLGLTSAVSFIDSAIPRTTVRIRYDIDNGDRRPTRADYLFSNRTFALPEPNVNQTELDLYIEYATSPWFSVFLDQPYRWVNPQANANQSGNADLGFGLKLSVWDTDTLLATIQVRGTAPTSAAGIDDRHWSVEPSLLFDWQLASVIGVEGQLGCRMPLTDAPLAGDVAKYGLGVFLGKRNDCGPWMTPVAEAIGWTCLGGASEIVDPSGASISFRGASGSTFVSGALGLRFGLGQNFEIYGGYERALTGTGWFREQIRAEFRLLF